MSDFVEFVMAGLDPAIHAAKTVAKQAVVSGAICLGLLQATAQAAPKVAFAPVQTCSQYSASLTANFLLHTILSSWAVGYVSGLAQFDARIQKMVATNGAASFSKLLDDFCARSPQDDFLSAIEAVGRE